MRNDAAHAPGMPVVAVVGDGQLARMMQTEAIELGASVRLLAGADDASAAQVCADVALGDYRDLADLRAVAAGADAVTFDHEHVPNEHLDALIADGVNVQPRPHALIHAQDKLVQRTRLSELGVPVPDFAAVDSVADALSFFERVDGHVCLKARRGGYDGKGVWFPDTAEELADLVEDLLGRGVPLMAERKIAFERELSLLVARRPSGEVRAWPVTESVQAGGVCVEAVAPAPSVSSEEADYLLSLAAAVATDLDVTGVLAVEMFAYRDDAGHAAFAVNELAMRPHNTGHWTQDGSVTSQFEQHLRAVLDLPLGDTAPTAAVTVMANTLGAPEQPDLGVYERCRQVWQRYPQAKIHLYGKTYRAGRKLGHVNLSGDDPERTRVAARRAADFLVTGVWPDGWTDSSTKEQA
ncbi:5-(carboxyamino)imidazole ribonucleotide synthase [Corynebacterium uterequi]|uniref:N5-carboxyaminoimidazole ribonucleotide synthase n=1 Tax=Corynebacterium uterequi TaxID=1072256 RepID=A0A0G3HEV8_9CORY|nr:5-(carboxyamino)imidazole ribonucleotide synthase [Corynebacterium uterequi]AKK10508.1 phosphoribosylaminoimidazole carboxylase, PurK protein [Corynebacterium uterequi]